MGYLDYETAPAVENYRLWLVKELTERTRRNPSYSLRSFAKSLGVSAPSLSQILSGKRPLSRKTALKIIDRCAISPEQGKAFLMAAMGESWQTALNRIDASAEPVNEFQQVQVETFRVIADWYHYAILSLGDIPSNHASPVWIAKKLNISLRTATNAFDRLLKLGLIKKRGKGFYQSAKPLAATTKIELSAALRHCHLETLRLAEKALEEGQAPLELFSSVTMAIDETKLPEARELIKKFRRSLCRLLESGDRQRVYTLAVGLFPVSTPTKGHP